MLARSFTLFILLLILAGCTSIDYQRRNTHTPDGYTDAILQNERYLITYETYKDAGNQATLEPMALRRAAEIARDNDKPYFDIIERVYEEFSDMVDIPKQVIKNTFIAGGTSGFGNVSAEQEVETIIPAHTRTFQIKKISITIQIMDKKTETTFATADYLK